MIVAIFALAGLVAVLALLLFVMVYVHIRDLREARALLVLVEGESRKNRHALRQLTAALNLSTADEGGDPL